MCELKELANGFAFLELQNDAACAEIALQGAHVFHYARVGEEPILWLSDESTFEEGKAIRGGVPICWPSFGMNNPKLPQHGFARTMLWKFVSCQDLDSSTTEVLLRLEESDESLKIWNYKFTLELKVRVSNTLEMELTTVNMDEKPFTLTQALHSYFKISHIENISIAGLENKPYLDALTNKNCKQNGEITFNGEVDRVYQEVSESIILKDQNRAISIKNEGSSSCVVWNPWIEKSKRMSAMSDEAFVEFVCIESSNAYDDFYVLKANESHSLKAEISIL